MDDKTFDLLSKMYSEFSEFRKEAIKRFDTLEIGQRKIETIIENDVKPEIKALFDGYKQTYEKLIAVEDKVDRIEDKVDDLSLRVDKQEFEIKVIKGGKASAL